jgi:hypothetical protein
MVASDIRDRCMLGGDGWTTMIEEVLATPGV